MFENDKILILGFARSGIDAARILAMRGNDVIVNDFKEMNPNDSNKVKELESV